MILMDSLVELFDNIHSLTVSISVSIALLFFCVSFPLHSSATGRLITSKEHASVQINIGEVDAEGRFTGQYKAYALSGYVRSMSEADDSLNRLTTQDGFLKSVWSYQQ